MKTRKNFSALCAIALSAAVISAPAVADKSETAHVRGVISAKSDSGFTLETSDGEMREVAMSSETKIAAAMPGDLSNIEEGTFIGTANVEKQGNNQALEMVIFPPSMKGAGLGDYAWDLSPSMVNKSATSSDDDSTGDSMASGSSMTNGTVESTSSGSMASSSDSMMSSGGSSMTNGTVTESSSDDEMLTLNVNYGEGSKTIQVPADVPTVKVRPGEMSDISEGAHVFVAGPQGSSPFKAEMVIVGVDGTVPPM